MLPPGGSSTLDVSTGSAVASLEDLRNQVGKEEDVHGRKMTWASFHTPTKHTHRPILWTTRRRKRRRRRRRRRRRKGWWWDRNKRMTSRMRK